jgi:hypothetical protein
MESNPFEEVFVAEYATRRPPEEGRAVASRLTADLGALSGSPGARGSRQRRGPTRSRASDLNPTCTCMPPPEGTPTPART